MCAKIYLFAIVLFNICVVSAVNLSVRLSPNVPEKASSSLSLPATTTKKLSAPCLKSSPESLSCSTLQKNLLSSPTATQHSSSTTTPKPKELFEAQNKGKSIFVLTPNNEHNYQIEIGSTPRYFHQVIYNRFTSFQSIWKID